MLHLCDIGTSKSDAKRTCFWQLDLQMYLAPQRRAIFRPFFDIRASENGPNTSWMLWQWRFFSILSCERASRHSGVQFFISPLNSYLRTRRFTEPTFRPSRPTNHWKNTAFRDFPNISRLLIFFLLTFAQLYLLSSDSTSLLCFCIFWLCYSALLFQLSILSEVRLLNFLWIRIPTQICTKGWANLYKKHFFEGANVYYVAVEVLYRYTALYVL